MSVLGRQLSGRLVAALATVMVLVALLPAVSATPEREIALVVKGMAFYLKDDPLTPNPTITVRVGERVRVVLRNEDRGMTHDFAVPGLGVVLTPITWNEAGDVVLEVPSQPGMYRYVCRPHSSMMNGAIRVLQ